MLWALLWMHFVFKVKSKFGADSIFRMKFIPWMRVVFWMGSMFWMRYVF
jgi:hypothetical protein